MRNKVLFFSVYCLIFFSGLVLLIESFITAWLSFSEENMMLSLVVTGLNPIFHCPTLATLTDKVGEAFG